jgi:hypothetical protein
MIAPALVTVLLNASDHIHMRTGYEKGDRLIPIHQELITYETEVTNFTKETEEMFVKFNRDERPGGMAHRSLSVGDVVLFETPYGRTALAVASIGFAPVNAGLLAEHFTSLL